MGKADKFNWVGQLGGIGNIAAVEKMNKKKTFILTLTFLLAEFLVHFPDFLRWVQTPEGYWFTGQTSWFDPWDLNVYFSAIGWGRRDGFLFANLYDTADTPAVPIYTIYSLLGKLLGFTGLSNAVIFHIGSFFTGILSAVVIWWVIGVFMQKKREQILAFALILLGGGLGWLFYPRILLPDLAQTGFIFHSALRRPHEAISYSLFILSLTLFLQGLRLQKKRFFFLGGISVFLLLLFHPYSILPIGVVLFSFGILRLLQTDKEQSFLPLVIIIVAGIVWFVLVGRTLIFNKGFSGLLEQAQSTPNLIKLLGGWGILLPFILIGLCRKSENIQQSFLKTWFITHLAVIYFPAGFQRLLIRGLWVAAVLLAVRGFSWVIKERNLNFNFFAVVIIILSSFSNLYIFGRRIAETKKNRWIYLSAAEGELIEYLKNNGEAEEGVLAEYQIANIIPANTNKRVWVGHEFQTPDFYNRTIKLNRFYIGDLKNKEVEDFLKETRVDWVLGKKELYPSLLQPEVEKEKVVLYSVLNRSKK